MHVNRWDPSILPVSLFPSDLNSKPALSKPCCANLGPRVPLLWGESRLRAQSYAPNSLSIYLSTYASIIYPSVCFIRTIPKRPKPGNPILAPPCLGPSQDGQHWLRRVVEDLGKSLELLEARLRHQTSGGNPPWRAVESVSANSIFTSFTKCPSPENLLSLPMRSPAHFTSKPSPTMELCARWAVPKASLQ